MSKKYTVGDGSHEPMEGYVDQIGRIKPKDVKQVKSAAGNVLREINEHTKNISQLEKERRAENEHPHAAGATDLGWCSREKLHFYVLVVKCLISGVLFPFFDIGSDIVTAGLHFYTGNLNWGILTVAFVLMPGFVCGLAIMVKGLKAQRISWKRTANYLIVVLTMPILYPICVILVNLYMVYLMILNKSREIVSIMGHDVKQFKSLEGFLEAGPQFVLQTYILLTTDKAAEDKSDAKAILILVVSITLSFLSLAKTGYNVNVPDPDDDRTSRQYPESAPKFSITSILFHLTCVLFRVTSLALFFSCFTAYTLIIIFVSFFINFAIYHISGASNTMTLLLGIVSIFMPNGYLLYNFAATFPVDFAFSDTRRLLMLHMYSLTPIFCAVILLIAIGSGVEADWFTGLLDEDSVLEDPPFTLALCCGLLLFGILSVATFLLHWKVSITKLYRPPRIEDAMETEEEASGRAKWLRKIQFWKRSQSTTEC